MSLVTCEALGSNLLTWLATASESDKAQLREALGAAAEDAFTPVTDCDTTPLTNGESVVTCEDYAEKIQELKTLETGSFDPSTKVLTLLLTNGDTVEIAIEYPDCN